MKKTREYYKELLDLGYVKGQGLTLEQIRQYRQGVLPPGVTPENIVQRDTADIYVPDIDAEEFMKKSNFLTIRNLRAIKRCLIFIVVLLAIGIAVGLIAGISALSQPDPVTIGTGLR